MPHYRCPCCCTCASLGCAELTCVVCFPALLLLLLLLLLQLSFVNGRPTEWNLISEMGTCRESSAACFSLTKVIEAPEHPEYDEGDAESPSTPAASVPELARGSIVKHKGRVGVVSRVRGPLSTPLSVDVVSSLSCFGSGASAHCCR